MSPFGREFESTQEKRETGVRALNNVGEMFREEGRQEIRDAVTEFRTSVVNPEPGGHCVGMEAQAVLETLARRIAPKSRRYVVAPAGAKLEPGECPICTGEVAPLTRPIYLKPGWTSDKECRDIVAELIRDGVEVIE